MTVSQAEQLLARIAKEADEGDDETAHAAEDDLRTKVLRAIAAGRTDDPAGLAAVALRSADIRFSRWCA